MLDAFNSLTRRIECVERQNSILTKRIEYLEGSHPNPCYGYHIPTPPIRSPYFTTPPPPEVLTSSSQQSCSESEAVADSYLMNKENKQPNNMEKKLVFDEGSWSVPEEASTSKKPLPPIQHNELISPRDVVLKYPTLGSASKIPTLAVRLAKEAFFGKHVMSFCTFRGIGSCHALPEAEVADMKAFLYKLCVPKHVTSKVEFENLYKKCVESVGQSCKSLRKLRLSNQQLV